MNTIVLHANTNRIYFTCLINKMKYRVLLDTGSPNTIITLDLAMSLGLPVVGKKSEIRLMGATLPVVPVVIPQVTLGSATISDVRVLAGLNEKSWKDTIILGLNVLNYFKYTINRETNPGHITLELNNRQPPSGDRSKFNYLLGNNGYYITNEGGDL